MGGGWWEGRGQHKLPTCRRGWRGGSSLRAQRCRRLAERRLPKHGSIPGLAAPLLPPQPPHPHTPGPADPWIASPPGVCLLVVVVAAIAGRVYVQRKRRRVTADIPVASPPAGQSVRDLEAASTARPQEQSPGPAGGPSAAAAAAGGPQANIPIVHCTMLPSAM